MNRRYVSLALWSVCAAALIAPPALAQTSPPKPVPTPAPGGTPVTFATVAPIGSPLPSAPPPSVTATAPPLTERGESRSVDRKRERFVAGDYLIAPAIYDEFSNGTRTGKLSYGVRGAVEFNFFDLPLLVGGELRDTHAYHPDANVTVIGRNGATFVAATTLRTIEYDGRLGIKLLEPRVYLEGSYLERAIDNGYPRERGVGFGLEKLPDFEGPLSINFAAHYYPNVTGNYIAPFGTAQHLDYSLFRYHAGITFRPHGSQAFLDLGVLGEITRARAAAPANGTVFSPYAGVGIFTP